MENCKGYEGACAALRRQRFLAAPNNAFMEYEPPVAYADFFHKEIWPVLTQAIINFPVQFVSKYVSSQPETEYAMIKPQVGLARRLLLPGNQINDRTLLDALTRSADVSNLFCIPFFRCTASVLVKLNVLSAQQAYHAQVPAT